MLGVESLHPSSTPTALGNQTVIFEFNQSGSRNFFDQFSRRFEDIEMAAQIAWVMVGDLNRIDPFEFQLPFLNQSVKIIDRI